jgi:transcriptional regulator with XRE-family HTH domain
VLAKRLVELRNKANLTQREFAQLLHISRDTYAQYETGRRNPDYDTLSKMADYYHATTDYLLGRTDISNPTAVKADLDAPLREKDLNASLIKIMALRSEFGLDRETCTTLINKVFDKFGPPAVREDGEAASGPKYPGSGALDKKGDDDK